MKKYLLILIFFFSINSIFCQIADTLDANDSIVVVGEIRLGGNKKTIDKVILRELLFAKGDTLLKNNIGDLFKRSKDNLFNTGLFNYITIHSLDVGNNYISVYILFEERWYLWPNVIFEHAHRNLSAFLHEGDWSKVNYGVMVTKKNFRGRRETLKFKFRGGYKEQFQVFYENPLLFNSRNHGFSMQFSWYRQNEASIKDEYNKQLNYKEEDNYVLKYFNTGLAYKFRNNFYFRHKLLFDYTYGSVNDSIILRNPNYFDGGRVKTQFFALNYFFDIDKRNYRHYPLHGFYYEFQLKQSGFNILSDEMKGIFEASTKYSQFFDFENRWYAGVAGKVKVSSNRKQPYFVEKGLGYEDFLRAYEYYVIPGQHFFTARSFIKYEILPTRITEISFVKVKKFNKIHYAIYSNIFFDSGYVKDVSNDPTNLLANEFLYSAGIGIDLVAYYDQIIRFEYSINKDFEHGFFLHVGKAF